MSTDNSEKYFGVVIFHLYHNGKFVRSVFYEVTAPIMNVYDLSSADVDVSIMLSFDQEEITLVEKKSNFQEQVENRIANAEHLAKKRMEDIQLLTEDVHLALRKLPIDKEIDLTTIEMLTSMIQKHQQELKKIIDRKGIDKVYVTEKITERKLQNGIETMISPKLTATWYKRNIATKATARSTAVEKVQAVDCTLYSDTMMWSIKNQLDLNDDEGY